MNDKATDWDGKVIFPFIFSCDVFQNSVVGVSPRVPGCTCVVSLCVPLCPRLHLCVPGRVSRSVSDSWVGDGHARSSIATSLSNPSLSSTSSPLKVSWQLYTEILQVPPNSTNLSQFYLLLNIMIARSAVTAHMTLLSSCCFMGEIRHQQEAPTHNTCASVEMQQYNITVRCPMLRRCWGDAILGEFNR